MEKLDTPEGWAGMSLIDGKYAPVVRFFAALEALQIDYARILLANTSKGPWYGSITALEDGTGLNREFEGKNLLDIFAKAAPILEKQLKKQKKANKE